MNKWEKNKSLKPFNTFGLEAKARYFAAPGSTEEIGDLLAECRNSDIPVFVLGGGSNVVFDGDFDGLVMCPKIMGIKISSEDSKSTVLVAGAGVVWDDFVRYAVDLNLGGIENLSGIPGTVGATPVQNIGAYGMEMKDSMFTLKGVMTDNASPFEKTKEACDFSYRSSIFKKELKRKTVITYVAFRLSKTPEYNLDYGGLKDELQKYGEVNLLNIRKSIISIRADKLPDPVKLGNAGSFFKNPVVEQAEANRLMGMFPSMPVYPAGAADKVKLSAGWMIENCSLKGYRENNIGVHHRQALALVNYGGGTAPELLSFSQMIQDKVFHRFGVRIEPEVDIVS